MNRSSKIGMSGMLWILLAACSTNMQERVLPQSPYSMAQIYWQQIKPLNH